MRIEDIDLGEPKEKRIPFSEREHIAFLLGSGFSVPCGMPTGQQLNSKILNIDSEPITESWEGLLAVSKDGRPYRTGSPQDKDLDFLKVLMKYYNENIAPFDYEAFYDYLHEKAIRNKEIEKLAEPYVSEYRNYEQLLYSFDPIYIQIVEYSLGKDRKTELQEDEFAEDKFSDYKPFVQ